MSIKGNSFLVSLSANANGRAIADAIRIERVSVGQISESSFNPRRATRTPQKASTRPANPVFNPASGIVKMPA